MKITVTPGKAEATVDTDDPAQAAAFVKALWNGSGKKRKAIEGPKVVMPDVELTTVQTKTWNWIVAHDSPQGVTSQEVADGLGIAHSAANYRLGELVSKGVIYRPRRGYYRPGERGD